MTDHDARRFGYYRYVELNNLNDRDDECIWSAPCTTDGTPCDLCGAPISEGGAMYACVGCGSAMHEWCLVHLSFHVCPAPLGTTLHRSSVLARRRFAIAWGIQQIHWHALMDPAWIEDAKAEREAQASRQ